MQPATENIKVYEVEKPKDLTLSVPSGMKEKAEELKSSAKAAVEKVKGKAGELKTSIDTSLAESTFSILGDDKDDKKEKEELTKDDIVVIDDIVVLEETRNTKQEPPSAETVTPESASFAQSLPSLSDQSQSLSAFELSSLEAGHDSKSLASASTKQPQSLSTYEFPSLQPEKSKSDNGSDIEVLPNDEKTKHHEKPASDTPGPSHIPKVKKDTKKSSATAASSSESGNVDSTKDTKRKGRKGSRDAKCKDETEASSGETQIKGKEAAKAKPPPVPPKPKQLKPDTSHQTAKEQEVHIKHPINRGEFVSFGMKFESQDSTPDHIITGVEDGGPASEVGLK